MLIDPNILRIAAIIIVVGLVFLAFTKLLSFFRPLIVAAILLAIAYFVYRYFVTGTFSF